MSEQGQVLVSIFYGSASDLPKMQPVFDTLKQLGVGFEHAVASAHRTPDRVAKFIKSSEERGVQVFICAAGMAAHLAGAVAAKTLLPVIGLPVAAGPLNGQDALLATVQMPKGYPVATVAIDGGINAALLAAQIVAAAKPEVREALAKYRSDAQSKITGDPEVIA